MTTFVMTKQWRS